MDNNSSTDPNSKQSNEMTADGDSAKADRRRFLKRSASVVGAASLATVPAACAGGPESLPGDEISGKPRRSYFEGRIIARAWRDPEYRDELLSNPRSAVSEELDIEVPEETNIEVLEEREDTLYLVLPRNPNEFVNKELSDEELRLLANGVRFDTACAIPSSAAPAFFVELGYYPRSEDVPGR